MRSVMMMNIISTTIQMEHQKAMKKVITPTMMITVMMLIMRKNEVTKQIKNKKK